MMKKILLITLLMIGCNDFAENHASNTGEVNINGKQCKVSIVSGPGMSRLYYVDCGPCSESAVNYQQSKTHVTVVQSAEPSCSCPAK